MANGPNSKRARSRWLGWTEVESFPRLESLNLASLAEFDCTNPTMTGNVMHTNLAFRHTML